LLNGTGGGWVRTADVILFVDRAAIPVEGGGVLNTGGERGTLRDDLIEPPLVGTENAGSGIPYLPYNFAACGDTYWLGDGASFTMEDLAYQGRYPRFSRPVVRVYVHGLVGEEADWELAISQAFAQISQG